MKREVRLLNRQMKRTEAMADVPPDVQPFSSNSIHHLLCTFRAVT